MRFIFISLLNGSYLMIGLQSPPLLFRFQYHGYQVQGNGETVRTLHFGLADSQVGATCALSYLIDSQLTPYHYIWLWADCAQVRILSSPPPISMKLAY